MGIKHHGCQIFSKYFKYRLIAVSLISSCAVARADIKGDDLKLFNKAVKAYEHHDYKQAVEGFEQLINRGYDHDARLFYNLAIALQKNNHQDLTKAIAATLTAKELLPRIQGLDELLVMLEERAKVSYRASKLTQQLAVWVDLLSYVDLHVLYYLLMLCLFVLMVAILCRLKWSDNEWVSWIDYKVLGVLGICVLVFFSCLFIRLSTYKHWVVVQPSGERAYAGLYTGPGAEFEERIADLVAGDAGFMAACRHGWLRVQFANGIMGWLDMTSVVSFDPCVKPMLAKKACQSSWQVFFCPLIR